MSSISGATSSVTSPLARLQAQLSTDVQAGTIKAADQSALSGALSSIDGSLSAGRSTSTGSRPDPSELKSKIDGLIQQQVSAGTLTSDQASELSSLFSEAAPKGHHGGHGHGHGGPGGPGGLGASPPPPPSDDTTGAVDGSSSATSITGTPSAGSSQSTLNDFLKQLQSSLTTGYGANGSGTSGSSTLLFAISV